MMVFALTTGHEIGLAVMGGLFIGFSLLSSFVFPRLIPDFPTKKGLRWYLPLGACFFIAMLAAVLVFGREKKEVASAATPPTTATSPAGTTTAAGSTGSSKYAGGDAAAGKTVFASAGCAACHVFTPAAATGKVGPSLDELASYAKHANQPLLDFTVAAITKPPPPYVPPGFPTNAMPTNFGTTLSTKQIADLSAFLDAGDG